MANPMSRYLLSKRKRDMIAGFMHERVSPSPSNDQFDVEVYVKKTLNQRDADIMVMLLTAQVGAPPHHCAAAVPARVVKAKAFIFVY